jgi:hypothetical protein
MCKILLDAFPIENVLKQGDALPPLFVNFALDYAITRSKKVMRFKLKDCVDSVNILGKTQIL